MSHTPGPWRYTIAEYGCTTIWADKHPIAIVYSCDEKKANAALIAAAPDLLAALKYLLECAENGTEPGYGIAIRAIEKAEGKQ